MIRIFSASDNYKSEIILLWKSCFGDSEDYINFFLDNCPGYIGIGCFEEDKLVSVLFLLEGEICSSKCKYLYAACTDEDFRRRGIMESLIAAAESYCRSLNYSGIFLVPANENLYKYYAKFGFISSFFKSKLIIAKQNNVNFPVEELFDFEKILSVKKRLLSKVKAFVFEEKVMKYTIKEHFYNGGSVVYFTHEGKEALAFYYLNDNNDIIVKELLSDFDDSVDTCEKLFSKYSNENIYICTPIVYNSKDKVEEYTKCGMCFPLCSGFSEFLKAENELYAGMYLD